MIGLNYVFFSHSCMNYPIFKKQNKTLCFKHCQFAYARLSFLTTDCPQFHCVKKYIAQQPDELTLEESDVINVTRKMADGTFI